MADEAVDPLRARLEKYVGRPMGHLRPGDRLHLSSELESISNRKTTALGQGYFVTWATTYRTADGEVVGCPLFRILKFDPRTTILPSPVRRARRTYS